MDDVETTVRRIVELSNVNIITKKMVRAAYKNIKGTISAAEVGLINAALEKIISELSQKIQSETHLDIKTRNYATFKEDEIDICNMAAHSADDQQVVKTKNLNEISKKTESCSDLISKDADRKPDIICTDSNAVDNDVIWKLAKDRSFALNHLCSSTSKSSRNKERHKLMTSTEAFSIILSSDFSVDSSDNDLNVSPHKAVTSNNKLSEEVFSTQSGKDQISKITDNTRHKFTHIEKCNPKENITPAKKFRLQEHSFSLAATQEDNENISSLANQVYSPVSKTDAVTISQEHCHYGITITPQGSFRNLLKRKRSKPNQGEISSHESETGLMIDEDFTENLHNTARKEKLEIVKCKKRKKNFHVFDSSSDDVDDDDETCLKVDSDFPKNLYDVSRKKNNGILKCKKQKKNLYVFESSSDSDDSNKAKWASNRRALEGLGKQELETVLVLHNESLGNESAESDSNSVHTVDRNNIKLTSPDRKSGSALINGKEHQQTECNEESSDDSLISFNTTRKRRKKKRALECLDDDILQGTGSPQIKRCGKHAKVMVKIVDRNSSDVDEIKYAVISDSKILENLEKESSRVRTKKRKNGKVSISENKGLCKKQKTKQEHGCIEISNENSVTEIKNKQNISKLDIGKSSKTTASARRRVLDLNDEDYVPLKCFVNSSRDSVFREISTNANPRNETVKELMVVLEDIKKKVNKEKCSSVNTSLTNKDFGHNSDKADYSSSNNQNECGHIVDSTSRKHPCGDSISGKQPCGSSVESTPKKQLCDSSIDSTSRKHPCGVSTFRKHPCGDSTFRKHPCSSSVNESSDEDSPEELSETNPCTEDNTLQQVHSRSSGCDEHVSSSSTFKVTQDVDSDSSSSLSDISSHSIPSIDVKKKNLTPRSDNKSSKSSTISYLRRICRGMGIILRNTIELADCHTEEDTIKRMKKLLEAKGMKGRPSLNKVKKLNLLKELKELQCEEVTLNTHKRGRSRRKENNISSQRQENCFQSSFQSVFSHLKDIVTVDDSDSL